MYERVRKWLKRVIERYDSKLDELIERRLITGEEMSEEEKLLRAKEECYIEILSKIMKEEGGE